MTTKSKRNTDCEPSGLYASYLSDVYRGPKLTQIVMWAAVKIQALKGPDGSLPTIVHTGTSGAAVAWPLVMQLGCTSVCVQKEGVSRHGGEVEGHYLTYGERMRFVFVDDFISSGKTFRHVCGKLARFQREMGSQEPDIECVGVIQYHETAKHETAVVDYVLRGFAGDIRYEAVMSSVRSKSVSERDMLIEPAMFADARGGKRDAFASAECEIAF